MRVIDPNLAASRHHLGMGDTLPHPVASPSVDFPLQDTSKERVPAILDRVRTLVVGIGSSTDADLAVGHHHLRTAGPDSLPVAEADQHGVVKASPRGLASDLGVAAGGGEVDGAPLDEKDVVVVEGAEEALALSVTMSVSMSITATSDASSGSTVTTASSSTATEISVSETKKSLKQTRSGRVSKSRHQKRPSATTYTASSSSSSASTSATGATTKPKGTGDGAVDCVSSITTPCKRTAAEMATKVGSAASLSSSIPINTKSRNNESTTATTKNRGLRSSSASTGGESPSSASPQRRSKHHHHHHHHDSRVPEQRKRRHHHREGSVSLPDSVTNSAASSAMALDPPVLSFWGPDPVPLPSRFARIKRNLIAGHEAELEACWTRLIVALRSEVEHIGALGAHLIPSIEFGDIDDASQSSRFGRDLRRYGVGVVRRAVPAQDAEDMVDKTAQYLEARNNPKNKSIRPPPQDPTCFDFFWTPAQVLSRAHPSVLRTQRFMMGLWETTPDDRLAIRLPITYVDRIRIHGVPGNNSQREQKNRLGLASSTRVDAQKLQPAQSADDWITALQSSAGIIAQVDNGSLERWEPDGYQRAGIYSRVFQGRWEDYDPWESAGRVMATMDLYNGYAAASCFRMFQGVLALSTIEPGMIRLLPSPKLATAYYLLRPFFSPKLPAPDLRSGPEWDAYLAPENWELQRDPDTIIHGAVPGHAQRITEHWHPHLCLRSSMITLPTLQPGDYILWHPDLPYHISSGDQGFKTPSSGTNGLPTDPKEDISMLVYIPAAPLTQTNALYLARQRKAFQRGHPGPDFDSTGRGAVVEDPDIRPGEKDIADVGGPAGLQAMGLAPWEAVATRAGTPPTSASRDDVKDTTMSVAEAEVLRLSNVILFPDQSMMGYSV